MINQLEFTIKRCNSCSLYKDWSEFNKQSASKDGMTMYCRQCLKIKQQTKYKNDVEYRQKANNDAKSYYKLNKDKIKNTREDDLRARLIEIFRSSTNYFCDVIGCTGVEFRKYLIGKFEKGMESKEITKQWNFGFYVPINSFDLKDIAQRRKAFHYTNIYPKWKNEISKPIL